MTPRCQDIRPALERQILGEASAADLAALAAHGADCADCRALAATDRALNELAAASPELDRELAQVRQSVLRQARLEAGEPRGRFALPLWPARWALIAAAAIALLGGGVVAGRVWASAAAARDPLARALARAVAARASAHEPLDSPFTYGNVNVAPSDRGRLRLEFDVSTHVLVDRPANDPLVAEVVAQTLLAGASPLAGRLQAVAVAERVLDSRVRDALAVAVESDPDAVVRLKAFSELAERRPVPGSAGGADPAVLQVALRLLMNERSVQLRLAAIDFLTGNHVDRAALRRALDAADPATRGPLLVRASQYLQSN